MGCLWVRTVLLQGCTGTLVARGLAVASTHSSTRAASCYPSPAQEPLQRGSGWTHVANRPCLIKGLHHIYSKSLQENRA